MAIYQGDTKISGNAMMVALPMFFATYQPRKLNNPSWLRADPYSWHNADMYVSAYAHLAEGFNNCTKLHSWVNNGVYFWTTSTSPSVGDDVYGNYPRAVVGTVQAVGNNTITYNNTVYTLDTTYTYGFQEQIAGTTITFYKLSDEIKVVLPDQQANLDTIYNATGIGYYFVLDTTNQRFKLPRNIYGFTGYRGDVGGYVAESLPNHTHGISGWVSTSPGGAYQIPVLVGETGKTPAFTQQTGGASSSIYQNNAPVQQRATQAYLYFYVGNTVQNETSVDVAEMTEAINDKVNLSSSWGFPSSTKEAVTVAATGTSYTAPADGFFDARGTSSGSGQNINANNQDAGLYSICIAPAASVTMGVFMPVAKGDSFRLFYSTGVTISNLNFIYAKKTN